MKHIRSLAILGGSLATVLAGPALAAGAATPAAAAAHADANRVVGHAYVNDNLADINAVSIFDRHANGALPPSAEGPVETGGAGTGAGTGSQGALQLSPDGRYLLAVDAGSNQISVLRVAPDGGLTSAGVFASGGLDPVSIAIAPRGDQDRSDRRDLVYVANAGSGGSDYTGFTLGREGSLRPLAGSTVALPDGSVPGDILFNSSGNRVAATRVGTSLVDSFTVNRDGTLTAAPGSPYAGQGLGQIGAEFRPTNDSQLFVSNAHNGPGLGTVSSYRVSRTGALTSVGAGPVADNQTAPCWVEISHDGRYLFAVNTAVPSISSYAIAPDGSLTLLGTVGVAGSSGSVDTRLTPDGHTLYVTNRDSQSIAAFAVDGGTLTALGAPVAIAGSVAPVGLVVA